MDYTTNICFILKDDTSQAAEQVFPFRGASKSLVITGNSPNFCWGRVYARIRCSNIASRTLTSIQLLKDFLQPSHASAQSDSLSGFTKKTTTNPFSNLWQEPGISAYTSNDLRPPQMLLSSLLRSQTPEAPRQKWHSSSFAAVWMYLEMPSQCLKPPQCSSATIWISVPNTNTDNLQSETECSSPFMEQLTQERSSSFSF